MVPVFGSQISGPDQAAIERIRAEERAKLIEEMKQPVEPQPGIVDRYKALRQISGE